MEKAIDTVIIDPGHSFYTESSYNIETKYSTPDATNDSFTAQRNLQLDNKDCRKCPACTYQN